MLAYPLVWVLWANQWHQVALPHPEPLAYCEAKVKTHKRDRAKNQFDWYYNCLVDDGKSLRWISFRVNEWWKV